MLGTWVALCVAVPVQLDSYTTPCAWTRVDLVPAVFGANRDQHLFHVAAGVSFQATHHDLGLLAYLGVFNWPSLLFIGAVRPCAEERQRYPLLALLECCLAFFAGLWCGRPGNTRWWVEHWF
jgi:hypothetical protein